jgi:hypothetical protein
MMAFAVCEVIVNSEGSNFSAGLMIAASLVSGQATTYCHEHVVGSKNG